MVIFKTKGFDRWQKKEGLTDASLCHAVAEIERGLIDADLGQGLLKKRIPRPGRGKSSGFRTLLAAQAGTRYVFLYGFAKNERDNIKEDERHDLQVLAALYLKFSAVQLTQAVTHGALKEICI